jgi:epoxyqueuosine reductase QueG
MDPSKTSPPVFAWEDWYAGTGGRSITIPEVNDTLKAIFTEQLPRFEGEALPERKPLPSPDAAADLIKEKALEFGADVVGICELSPDEIYRDCRVEGAHAVAIGHRMRYRAFQTVPSRESAIEQIRVYYELGRICIELADFIRGLGYHAKVQAPVGDSEVLHVPIALKAGFGELGRHGSIIHPKLGPLFRLGTVTTTLELACDAPIDAGIAEFCDYCRACRIFCPADAVPDERNPAAGKDHLGFDRYQIDTGKCFPYFARNYYCAACLPVCVYNHKEWARDFEGFETKKFPEVVMEAPPRPFDGIPSAERHIYPKLKRE